jgi:hypothetical protein
MSQEGFYNIKILDELETEDWQETEERKEDFLIQKEFNLPEGYKKQAVINFY